MTNFETIKNAVERCAGISGATCDQEPQCPFNDCENSGCNFVCNSLLKNVLALINEQNAKIIELTTQITNERNGWQKREEYCRKLSGLNLTPDCNVIDVVKRLKDSKDILLNCLETKEQLNEELRKQISNLENELKEAKKVQNIDIYPFS